MSNIRTAIQSTSQEITASIAQKTLIASLAVLQPLLDGAFADIEYLVLANNSATPTLVTISDDTNDYYYEVAANSTFKAVGFGETLMGSSKDTPWTIQCSTSISSLFVSCNYSVRQ